MNRHFLVSSLAALLCGGLQAQQIVISNQTWVVIPGQLQIATPFHVDNAPSNPGGFIDGLCLTEVGTSTTGSFLQGNVSFTGIMQGGPTISTSVPTQTASATETYSRLMFNGRVNAILSAQMGPSVINQSGTGFNAVANVSASCTFPISIFPVVTTTVTSSASANVVPGGGGFLTTAPQTATASLTGINFWFLTMSATGNVTASMSGTNGFMQCGVICNVTGGARLN